MPDLIEDEPKERLRPRPVVRFAGLSRAIDLAKMLEELRAEPHAATNGHRQIAVFQWGPVTEVLYAFEPGGEIPGHSAPGLVTIHVLEGRLMVLANGQDHELNAGSVLILNPDVPHDVRSPEGAAMLLTVHLEGES
ncbi:MAG: cupin domain-containing protein [Gemmatimonadaceae bacterium]|nr:cupin domain-containing protein [Gemmatimonadaceae bacterium]